MLLTHQDNVDSKEGFETEGNLVAFARYIHTWFDRGVWSLKVKARDDDSCENKAVFYWLPDGFNNKALFPDNG